jgi:uncharacterized protein DUF1569
MDPLLERLQQEVTTAHTAMTAQQLSWHPPGKWSAAEILEHLYLTYTGTTKGFSRVLEAGSAKVTPPTWKQRAGKVLVLSFSYFPTGREAPAMSRPRGLPLEKVLAEMTPKIREMDEMISVCEQKLGRGELLDHLILGPLTASQWRKFHFVHGLHHVKQIQRLKNRPSS